jgi:hypothetical protein
LSKKLLRTVGKIATVVAAVAAIATGVGAALGGTMVLAIGGTTIAASAIAGAASLISMGASLLGRPKSPQIGGANQDRLTVSLDVRAPRVMAFGRTALATDLRDQEFTGADKEYLHRFIVVAAHRVNAIQELWFDDKLAWTSAGGVQGEFVGYLTATPVLEGGPANAINISARMGATRRFTGLAYLYLRFKLTGNSKKTESPFAQQVPTRVTIVGEGIPCYDPRQDSTQPGGAGAHRAANQATWTYGAHARNLACQYATYLLGWRIQNPQSGTWKLSVGAGTPPDRFDWPSFIEGANLCDEPVALAAGGTEPRYRGDGLVNELIDPIQVTEAFKAAMNADVDDQDGLIRLTVFHNDLAVPDAVFSTEDVENDYQWLQTPPLNESFNVVRGTFVDPDPRSLYQPNEYREVRIASPDGIDRVHPADFGFVQSRGQAERLAKQRLQRELYGGTFRSTFLAPGWKVQKNSPVRLNFAPEGWTNKLFRVAEYENARPDGRVPMVLREEHANIYAWDAEESPAVQIADPTEYSPGDGPIPQFLGTVAEGATAGATVGENVYKTPGVIYTQAQLETSLGTAAAIADQGALATKGSVNFLGGTDVVNLPFALQAFNGGYLYADRAAYNAGVTLESLKPQEANSNVTENRTAAAIVGQAPAATDSTIQAGATNDRFVDTRSTNELPSWYRTNHPLRVVREFKDGQALGITGAPGSWGMLETTVDYSDASGGRVKQLFTGGGAGVAGLTYRRVGASDDASWETWLRDFSELQKPYFGSDLLEAAAGAVATLPNFKTGLGTAAAIAGQGALATKGSVNFLGGSDVTNLPFALQAFNGGYLYADRAAYNAGVTLESLKPQEANSNVTENRTAAAIAGQAPWATSALPTSRLSFINDAGRALIGPTGFLIDETNSYYITNAIAVTSQGTAAAIAGQTAWATYGGSTGRVANLNDVGRAAAGFASSGDARPFAKLVSSGASNNGEAVSFGTSYGQVPKIAFGMGGKAPSAGTEVQVRADGLTVSGFTMKAVEVALTPGTTYTDSVDAAGGAGQPQRVMHKSQNLEPWDGKYTFRVAVTVPQLQPGEPGFIDVAIFARQGGVWTQIGYRGFTANGSYDVVLTPGAIPQTADYEFGVSVGAATNGATLDALVSVKYTSGTITETALTANTTIPWIAHLEQ